MQFTRAEGECPEGKTWKGSDLDGEGAVQCTGEQGGWLPGRSWPGVAGQTMATKTSRNSLAVLWLGLHALTTKDLGSIPRRGTKIPQAVAWSQRPPEHPPGKPHGGGEGVRGEVAVVSCRRGSHTQSSCPRDCRHCHGPVAFRVSGQREGVGLGRPLAYLERAAEKLPPG